MATIPNHPEPALPAATQLAIERTLLAHERTLMAWVRTAASLISFGFTIYKFFEGLRESAQVKTSTHILGARTFGLLMICIGLTSLILATVQHRRETRKLDVEYHVKDKSLAMFVAGLISFLGVVGLLAVIFRQ